MRSPPWRRMLAYGPRTDDRTVDRAALVAADQVRCSPLAARDSRGNAESIASCAALVMIPPTDRGVPLCWPACAGRGLPRRARRAFASPRA